VDNLSEDWMTVNFPLWVYHCIPVYYRWNTNLATDPHFAHVSPASFQEPNSGRSRYDGFFQDISLRFPIPRGLQNSLPAKGHMVIDFKGWGRREVEKSCSRSYFGKLPFQVQKGMKNRFALFYRWRALPKQGPSDLDSDSDGNSTSDSETDGSLEGVNRIREVFRWKCAPHSGRRYELDTGKRIEGCNTGAEESRMLPGCSRTNGEARRDRQSSGHPYRSAEQSVPGVYSEGHLSGSSHHSPTISSHPGEPQSNALPGFPPSYTHPVRWGGSSQG